MSPGDGPSWDTAAKAELCALLARLFAGEVDSALYGQLRRSAGSTLPWLEPALLELPEARALELLAVEYCRLFVGPQPLCPPYASADRQEALLGGGARTRLEAFAAAHGVPIPADEWRVASPDHIAIELAMLAYLYAEGFPQTVVREFLSRHLLPWAPHFLANVESHARYQLYHLAAQLGAAVLAEEAPGAGEGP